MLNRNFELTRKMGHYDVVQRTKDGMFDANALLRQWNLNNPNKKKQMDKFLNTEKTKEFITTITKREGYNEIAESDISTSVLKIVKPRGIKGGGRTEGAVWMHPLLFIDFAMYLNVDFKYDVLKFVQDQLITTRNNIADSHKKWKSYMSKIGCVTPDDFSKCQKVFNVAVFGFHETGMRDKLTQEHLNDMMDQEKMFCQLIDMEIITDEKSFFHHCKKLFELRFSEKIIKDRAKLAA